MKAAASRPYIMPVSTTRSELLKKRVDQFTRVLDAVEKGDVRALHQARVASRRMRELVPMLQLERRTSRKLGRRMRRVTTRLGTVRELDVLLILIDELHVSGRRGAGGLGRVGVRVAKLRDEARKKLIAHLPIADMSRLARKLNKIVDSLRDAEGSSSKAAARSWRWAIDARVAARASRLAAAMADAGALYLPERLHGVRIAIKKLRYAVELSAEAAGERAAADLRVLKRGQDLLGRMHDLQILIGEARQTQASLAPPSVAVWRDLDTLVGTLEDDCRRLHARYMRMRDALGALSERRSDQPHVPSTTRALARRAG
jgi:CHAD domain-containing protein